MHKIEWRPIAIGIGVTLALFIAIHEILRFCCYRGEFSAYGVFLLVFAMPFTAFISVFIILFPIAFLPLCIGSFIVGRCSVMDTFLQRLSIGIVYYLLSWVVWVFIFMEKYDHTFKITLPSAVSIILRIIDIFIFLGLSLFFYKIGMKYRERRVENAQQKLD